jgi:hypothetical protein
LQPAVLNERWLLGLRSGDRCEFIGLWKMRRRMISQK